MRKARIKPQKDWSICHIQHVIDHYKTRKYEDIGNDLGRSMHAVSDVLRRLGIGVGRGRRRIKPQLTPQDREQRRRFTPEARAMLFRETRWL